jgi:7,8-dihydroneopterin aldolase/epimerase/oxygenase
MRRIILEKLRVQASVGILEHELKAKQPLTVSVTLDLPQAEVLPKSDDIYQVMDYRRVRDTILDEINKGHVNMLETLAGRISERLVVLKGVEAVTLRVDKPSIFPDCDSIGIEVTSKRNPGQEPS